MSFMDMIKVRYYNEIVWTEYQYKHSRIEKSDRDRRVAFLRAKIKEREGVGRFSLLEAEIEPDNG